MREWGSAGNAEVISRKERREDFPQRAQRKFPAKNAEVTSRKECKERRGVSRREHKVYKTETSILCAFAPYAALRETLVIVHNLCFPVFDKYQDIQTDRRNDTGIQQKDLCNFHFCIVKKSCPKIARNCTGAVICRIQ